MKSKSYTKNIMIIAFALLAVIALLVVLFGASANRNDRESDANAIIQDFTVDDTFSFTNLQPTQTEMYKDDLTFSNDNSQFKFVVTWTRSGLPVEIGLLAQDGKEYSTELTGGSATGSIKDIPAGTYKVFLRNMDKNLELNETTNMTEVSGAVAFDF